MRVRVKKETSGYTEGKELNISDTSLFGLTLTVEQALKYGIVEELQEPQTLREKMIDKIKYVNWPSEAIALCANIANQHYLARFDEVFNKEMNLTVKEYELAVKLRKIFEEGEK